MTVPAYAQNFPDGLSGGAVLGGPGLVYDEAVRTIFSMAAADEITLK